MQSNNSRLLVYKCSGVNTIFNLCHFHLPNDAKTFTKLLFFTPRFEWVAHEEITYITQRYIKTWSRCRDNNKCNRAEWAQVKTFTQVHWDERKMHRVIQPPGHAKQMKKKQTFLRGRCSSGPRGSLIPLHTSWYLKNHGALCTKMKRSYRAVFCSLWY